MADITGVDHEVRTRRQRIDLIHRCFEGADHIRVRRFIESHVAITDLYKGEFSLGVIWTDACKVTEAVRVQDSALNNTKCPGARPGHAFEKTAAVDSIVIVIVQDFVFRLFSHSLSLLGTRVVLLSS